MVVGIVLYAELEGRKSDFSVSTNLILFVKNYFVRRVPRGPHIDATHDCCYSAARYRLDLFWAHDQHWWGTRSDLYNSLLL